MKKTLALLIALTMLLALMPVAVFADAQVVVSSVKMNDTASATPVIVANGVAITIEAGSTENLSKIKLADDSYFDFGSGQYEADLSAYAIIGGSLTMDADAVDITPITTNVTMTGGKVNTIYGGSLNRSSNAGQVEVSSATIHVSGGAVSNAIYGGGR